MSYIGKAATYLSNKAREITLAGTLAAALVGCQAVPQAPVMGAKEQLDAYKQRAEDYNKDKVINPCEVPGIIEDLRGIRSFKANLKDSDKVEAAMKTDLTGIEHKLKGYLGDLAKSDSVKAYVLVWRHRNPTNPNSSIRIFGMYENDHMAIDGKLAEHASALNIPVYDLDSTGGALNRLQAGQAWGYKRETLLDSEERKREISDSVVFVPKEKLEQVAELFHNKEIKNKVGERMTKETYMQHLKQGEIPLVALVYVLEPKEGEKPAK